MESSARVDLSLRSPGCKKPYNASSNSGSIDNSNNCFKSATRENCLRVNKEYVSEQIQMILSKLRDENEFHTLETSGHGDENFNDFLLDSEGMKNKNNHEFHSDSIKMWKNSLLDHLRSMKLSLDAS